MTLEFGLTFEGFCLYKRAPGPLVPTSQISFAIGRIEGSTPPSPAIFQVVYDSMVDATRGLQSSGAGSKTDSLSTMDRRRRSSWQVKLVVALRTTHSLAAVVKGSTDEPEVT